MDSPWPDHVPDRQPQHCPYCGETPGFGYLGQWMDMHKVHCPECGLEFAIVDPNTIEEAP